jgi:hypothetical protein
MSVRRDEHGRAVPRCTPRWIKRKPGQVRVAWHSRERAKQHISHRGKPQTELVGTHGGGRGAIGEQIELTFLDAFLHPAARAVDLLIEAPTVDRTGHH